jgi:hypothetical protein
MERSCDSKNPKKGDLTKCDNWRGISLLSIPSKIFGKILVNRMKKEVENILRKEQAGFRTGGNTVNHIFTLRNIIEQCLEYNATLYLNFIDFSKAFDSIIRKRLWQILEMYGIPQKYINIIRELYNNSKASVEVNGKLTDFFDVETGVRQGCVLSGLLFIIVVDWIMRTTIKDNKLGLRWKFTSVLEDLDFADDIVLISSRFRDLQLKTDRLAKHAEMVGLQINRNKTKTLRINQKSGTEINIKNVPIEDVEKFTYLGAKLSTEGGTDYDIQDRIAKAQNCFKNLNKIWRSSNITLRVKINFYKPLVKSVLLYGSETWKLTAKQTKQLEVFQNKCLRIIMKIFWPNTISNEILLRKANLTSIGDEIKMRRWRFIGHVLRMNDNEIPNVALTWAPEGSRRRGRPRLTWRRMMEKERNAAGWASWPEARSAALDRRGWKSRLKALCAPGYEKN